MFQMPQIPHDKLSASGVERGICTSNSPSTSKASATQPLGLFAFDSCIITNTVGQAQLMGKPADTPDASVASAVKQSIATSTTTTEVQANSGAIANNFDKDAVQSEIDLQMKVTQQFDTTRQQAKTIVNTKIDGLNKDIKALEDAKTAGTITADQDKLLTKKLAERNNWQIGGTIIDSIASGLSGPSSTGAVGILANAAAPQLQYQIGQYFKGTDAEGSTAHILAHTVIAAAVAAAGGNDALMAGLAAGGAEAVAPAVANWLYGSNPDVKKDADGNVIASELTAEQKNTLSNIIGLGTAGATGLAGGSVTDVVGSTGLAQTAVEGNGLADYIPSRTIHNPNQALANAIAHEMGTKKQTINKSTADYLYQVNTDPDLVVSVNPNDLGELIITGEWIPAKDGSGRQIVTVKPVDKSIWAVYGTLTLAKRPDGTYGIYNDKYDYEQHDSLLEIPRNIETYLGEPACSKQGGCTGFTWNLSGNIDPKNIKGLK